jgi:hypothetical protein
MRASSVRRQVTIALVASLVALPGVGVASGPSPSEAGFQRLKTLAGTWEAKEKGTTRTFTVTYVLTGRGTVLIEELRSGGGRDVGMSTAYHLDNGTLVLTHFCGAGNQPRMTIKSVDESGKRISFAMYDITNHADPSSFHSTALDVAFLDDGTIELAYRGMSRGSESTQTFHLVRRISQLGSSGRQ